MAYKRLVVRRAPLLAWFGALGLPAVYAMQQASRGMAHVCLALALVLAYCVFRGMHGNWWREIQVDLVARTVKTWNGTVVPFAQVGALSIVSDELRAENVPGPLYRAGKADLERARVALEAALGRGGPPTLFRLRRLTFHRSWGLFTFTLVCFALLTGAVLENIIFSNVDEIEYKLLAIGGATVCFLWFRRALFGTFTQKQLFVDPAAGVLQLEDGEITRLDELGELSIETKKWKVRRHWHEDFTLTSATHARLYTSGDRAHVELRQRAIETARLQHRLRRALGAPVVEGDAFRSGIDPKAEAKRIAGDSPHTRAALTALTHDPDPTTRARARELV